MLGNYSLGALGEAAAPDAGGGNIEYSPAEDVTLAAGETAPVEFTGQAGHPFAFDRIFCGGDLTAITATATFNQGRETYFSDVHLAALRHLTRLRRLKGLLRIGQRDRLVLTLTNRSGADASASVQLAGYGTPAAIEEQEKCLRATYGYLPQPDLLTGYTELPAGATGQIQVRRSYAVRFRRFFIVSDAPEGVRASLKLYSDTILEPVRLEMITDRFLQHEAPSPMVLDGNTPLSVVLSNTGAQTARVSVLFEAYRERELAPAL